MTRATFGSAAYIFGALLASYGAPTISGELEDCAANVTGTDAILCGTALEFGTQAAFIRETLETIDGPRGLRPSAKDESGREWFGLSSVMGQATSGSFTGESANVIFGADTEISETASFGVLAYYDVGEVTSPGNPTIARQGVLVGPYFSVDFDNDGRLNGQLLYGQQDYTITNVTTSGETIIAGLSYSRFIDRDGVDYAPFAALSLKHEEPGNGNVIDAQILTFGTSFEGDVTQTSSGFRQYFGRVELDVGNYTDQVNAFSVSYAAPRIAVGSRYAFENGSVLQLSGNVSTASDQTTIVALQAAYRFDF